MNTASGWCEHSSRTPSFSTSVTLALALASVSADLESKTEIFRSLHLHPIVAIGEREALIEAPHVDPPPLTVGILPRYRRHGSTLILLTHLPCVLLLFDSMRIFEGYHNSRTSWATLRAHIPRAFLSSHAMLCLSRRNVCATLMATIFIHPTLRFAPSPYLIPTCPVFSRFNVGGISSPSPAIVRDITLPAHPRLPTPPYCIPARLCDTLGYYLFVTLLFGARVIRFSVSCVMIS